MSPSTSGDTVFGDDLGAMVRGIALAHVRATAPEVEGVVDEHGALAAEVGQSFREVLAHARPRLHVGEVEQHRLVLGVLASRHADDLGVGPRARARQRLADARRRPGDPHDVRRHDGSLNI